MLFAVSAFLDAVRLFFRRIWPGANSWSPKFLIFWFSSFGVFYLILFHLIRDHLQPCDEVPVDDCATFAFVLQKPFTVVSDIIPFAVLLALKHFVRKGEIVGFVLRLFFRPCIRTGADFHGVT